MRDVFQFLLLQTTNKAVCLHMCPQGKRKGGREKGGGRREHLHATHTRIREGGGRESRVGI